LALAQQASEEEGLAHAVIVEADLKIAAAILILRAAADPGGPAGAGAS
jgi:hypothetical protein